MSRDKQILSAVTALLLCSQSPAVELPDVCPRDTGPDMPLIDLELSLDEQRLAVRAEHALSAEHHRQGLQCRASLAPGSGMLFSYPRDTETFFWMFNTYIPLDILYLDAQGRVIDYARMRPCPQPKDLSLADWQSNCYRQASYDYRPRRAIRQALELPAGWLEAEGLAWRDISRLQVTRSSADRSKFQR